MRNKADISYVLKKSLRNSTKLNQKGLAAKAKVANATVSDNSNGRAATFDKAVNYAKAFGEADENAALNELTSDFSYSYLGFLKSMDGPLADICTTSELDIFQKMESEERKERKNRAELLIVHSKIRSLDSVERNELKQYVLEFLDEIIVELAIVFSILKIIGMSIQEAMSLKMPEWVAKKYMRG